MSDKHLRALVTALRSGLLAGASFCLLLYLFVAISRIGYPFEIEWQEGGTLAHVERILAGEPLYVPPALDFIPFIYAPLYYYVCAAFAKVAGLSMTSLRLVSFLSSLGCFLTIFFFVKRESASKVSGFIAAALFAATFESSSSWFDIARVDSLFMFLVLTAAYLLRFQKSLLSLLGAGLLFGMAFLAKQAALVIALPLMLYTLIALRGVRRFAFAGVFGFIVAASTLAFNALSDGWYGFYVLKVPSGHAIEYGMIFKFWTEDIARPVAIAFGLTLFYLWRLWFRDKEQFSYYAMLFLGTVGEAWFSRMHTGGYPNVLMPAYAMLAIGLGLGSHSLISFVEGEGAVGSSETEASEGSKRTLVAVVYLFACIQFLSLIYDPRVHVPTEKDIEAGRRIVQVIGDIDGEVLVHMHGYLSVAAGKQGYSHAMAWFDVVRSGEGELQQSAAMELMGAIANKRFAAIILDEYDPGMPRPPYWEAVEANYTYGGPLLEDDLTFWTRSGFRTRPQHLYLAPKGNP